MSQAGNYDRSFFEDLQGGAHRSAEVIVPLLMQWVKPASVIDLGCGTGDWLAVFREAGVSRIRGVDGAYVEQAQLQIPEQDFRSHDLSTPYPPDGSYDLAMSVEVAEHLPAGCAAPLVESLTAMAPVVLFSAAIPNQSGQHHINCQWPDYWAGIFAACDYVVIDTLRYSLWTDSRVDWWYRQNIMLYVRAGELPLLPELQTLRAASPLGPAGMPLPLIHPDMFEALLKWGLEQQRKYWDLYAQMNPP